MFETTKTARVSPIEIYPLYGILQPYAALDTLLILLTLGIIYMSAYAVSTGVKNNRIPIYDGKQALVTIVTTSRAFSKLQRAINRMVADGTRDGRLIVHRGIRGPPWSKLYVYAVLVYYILVHESTV